MAESRGVGVAGGHLRLATCLIVMVIGLVQPVAAAAAVAEVGHLPGEIRALYFSTTSHNLSGGFLRHWWENGQLDVFGYPLSEEMVEGGRTVQYFERARYEHHPEYRGTPYEIQLSHLGRQEAAGLRHSAFEPVGPVGENRDRDYFEATGHTLAYAFKNYWEAHNGLANFGYPISEEFSQDGLTVQYFERARFEFHPALRATAYEVQLTHLGRQAFEARRQRMVAAAPLPGAIEWTPSLSEEIAARQRAELERTWLASVAEPIDPFQAIVRVSAAEVRQAPTRVAARVTTTYERHIVHVVGQATGEPIAGNNRWYRVMPSGGYIAAAQVAPFSPAPPPTSWPGRWIDVNLSTFYATGYEGTTPLYSAIITAGRENRTPTGVFTIFRRTRSETMDSATVGYPKGHPEYYYLENVEYVQYITGQGHALHGNYWVHPSRFGRFSSNGCVGLQNHDAAWFWQFADFGTPVHIHY